MTSPRIKSPKATRAERPRSRVQPVAVDVPIVVGGRYAIQGEVGTGGFGIVYRATDLLTGDAVAVKAMRGLGEVALQRVRREVAALRLLALPGVVRLLDEVTEGNDRFLIMELLEGKPFPAGRHAWPELAPVAIALLETLHRVHQSGVVHRDLKPANVLVSADGRPTILDFGISRGEPVGTTITGEGAVLGTPGYLAPEQLMGQRADTRSDLYAVGIMLFEALAGRSPHATGPGGSRSVEARVTMVPPSLRSVQPAVPQEVAEVVDRLLAPQPHHRPASAAEVCSLLRGEGLVDAEPMGWLGPSQSLTEAIARIMCGESVVVTGSSGCGKTRALREIALELQLAGRPVLWLRPSRIPFGSLVALRPPDAALAGLGLLEAATAVRDHLLLHARDLVLFADDWELLDRWSADVLDSARPHICLVRSQTAAAPGAVNLQPFDESALRGLFLGQQRLLHEPEDAASLLYQRTGGQPQAVRTEVEVWVRAGLATWSDGRVAVSRNNLNRLRATMIAVPMSDTDLDPLGAQPADWAESVSISSELAIDPFLRDLLVWMQLAWPNSTAPVMAAAMALPPWQVEAGLAQLVAMGAARRVQGGRHEPRTRATVGGLWTPEQAAAAHKALAEVLPSGTERRLFHLVAAGETHAIATEAATVARALMHAGKIGDAEAIVTESLRAIRDEGGARTSEPLLSLLVQLAWATGSVRALELAKYEVQRGQPAGEDTPLSALVEAAVLASKGTGAAVLQQSSDVPAFADEALDTLRQAVRKHAARGCLPELDAAVVADIEAWATKRGTPAAQAHAQLWKARLQYRQGKFAEAAQLDQAAAQSPELPLHLRLTTMTYGASALLSAFQYAEAKAMAAQALSIADAGRHIQASARAEWILRAAEYRSCEPLQADLEWATSVASAGLGQIAVPIMLTEATIAWRAGDLAGCAVIARPAAELAREHGMEPFGGLLRLLLAIADPDLPRPEPAQIAREAEAAGHPEVSLQMYALGAIALGAPQPGWLNAARRHARLLPAQHGDLRLDILSPAEAVAAVRRTGSRPNL